MKKMTSIERVNNILSLEYIDSLAIAVTPLKETVERWRNEGYIRKDEDVYEHFGQDIRSAGQFNSVADIDHKDIVLDETEKTILTLNGNGAKLRRHKHCSGTPEHVDFLVKDYKGWMKYIKPHLVNMDRRRIPFEEYHKQRTFASEKQRFFCWRGLGPFEQIHPVCGHENMLMAMAIDPNWVKEMAITYANFTINHLDVLFAEEGRPDALFFSEDMGFKSKPFMSPSMYKDIIWPAHKLLFDYAHLKGCKVIVHSCGFIEPLVPMMIDAGMDCLQAIEVKAEMDLIRLFKKFGERIAFFGGIDSRVLLTNDKKCIDEELKKIVPVITGGGSYILHSDHSEPPGVDYETMWYFIKKGKKLFSDVLRN